MGGARAHTHTHTPTPTEMVAHTQETPRKMLRWEIWKSSFLHLSHLSSSLEAHILFKTQRRWGTRLAFRKLTPHTPYFCFSAPGWGSFSVEKLGIPASKSPGAEGRGQQSIWPRPLDKQAEPLAPGLHLGLCCLRKIPLSAPTDLMTFKLCPSPHPPVTWHHELLEFKKKKKEHIICGKRSS
jgi:hypothetical protein